MKHSISASDYIWRAHQTAVGTPGVDYAIPNPELVKTKICYGLTPTGLTTVVAAYTEVHPTPHPHALFPSPEGRTWIKKFHMRTAPSCKTHVQHLVTTFLHGGGSVPWRFKGPRAMPPSRVRVFIFTFFHFHM